MAPNNQDEVLPGQWARGRGRGRALIRAEGGVSFTKTETGTKGGEPRSKWKDRRGALGSDPGTATSP